MPNQLYAIKKELRLREAPGIVYGYYDGYLVSFSSKDRRIEMFIDAAIDNTDGETFERLRAFLQANVHGYNITNTSLSNTGITVKIEERDYRSLLDFFFILLNQLKVFKILGASSCSNCGAPLGEDQVIIKIGSHAHACDQACAEKILSNPKAQTVSRAKSRAMPGLLGALIFSALGALPYFYLGYRGMSCYWAAFLIPLATALGYQLFTGQPGVGKLIICSVAPLLAYLTVACTLLVYLVGLNWYDAGYVYTISELLDTVWQAIRADAALQNAFLYKQVLYGGIFLFIGYVFTLPTAYAPSERYLTILKGTVNE